MLHFQVLVIVVLNPFSLTEMFSSFTQLNVFFFKLFAHLSCVLYKSMYSLYGHYVR